MKRSDVNKSSELYAILSELSHNDLAVDTSEKRQSYYDRLESIYYIAPDVKYRHMYSEIFQLVAKLKNDDPVNLDILGENLKILANNYIPLNHDRSEENNTYLIDVGDCILKLYDHVNLEIMRMRYSDLGDKEISKLETIKDLNQRIQSLQVRLNNEQKSIKGLRKSQKRFTKKLQEEFQSVVDKNKVDFITVLGLFSGIIITFVASLVFSSSVLQSIHQASIYRISFAILLLTLFIFNIIYACLFFIARINQKENSKEMIMPLVVVNLILWFLILGVIGSYWFGVTEKRNARVLPIQQSTESSVESESEFESVTESETEVSSEL